MGTYCEIKVHKPPYGAYFGSVGSSVSGVIKYVVDKQTTFTKIIVSLKGVGRLCIEDNQRSNKRLVSNETYIDLENIIQDNAKNIIVPVGAHETQFKFEIPHNVPATLSYTKITQEYKVKCKISYYIIIKFYTLECMKLVKRFRKEVDVISGIIPRLATIPIVYGDQIRLTQILTSEPKIFLIKVRIMRSVLKCGEKILLFLEVCNDTNVAVTAVETKLVEVYKFFLGNKEDVKIEDDVPGTDSKTVSIESGETQEMSVEINLPPDRSSGEFSRLFSRHYFVYITIHLPKPHENYVLEIPVQIGVNKIVETADCEMEELSSNWEAMNLYTSDKIEI